MSHDKAIASGQEHRKPYRGAKSIDRTCENHGGCECCERGRTFKSRRAIMSADEAIEEALCQ